MDDNFKKTEFQDTTKNQNFTTNGINHQLSLTKSLYPKNDINSRENNQKYMTFNEDEYNSPEKSQQNKLPHDLSPSTPFFSLKIKKYNMNMLT